MGDNRIVVYQKHRAAELHIRIVGNQAFPETIVIRIVQVAQRLYSIEPAARRTADDNHAFIPNLNNITLRIFRWNYIVIFLVNNYFYITFFVV